MQSNNPLTTVIRHSLATFLQDHNLQLGNAVAKARAMMRVVMAQEQLVQCLQSLVDAGANCMQEKLAFEESDLFALRTSVDLLTNKDLVSQSVPEACVRWNMAPTEVFQRCWDYVQDFDSSLL